MIDSCPASDVKFSNCTWGTILFGTRLGIKPAAHLVRLDLSLRATATISHEADAVAPSEAQLDQVLEFSDQTMIHTPLSEPVTNTKRLEPCVATVGVAIVFVPPVPVQPIHEPATGLELSHVPPLSVPLTTRCSVPAESMVSAGAERVEPPSTSDHPVQAPLDKVIVLYQTPLAVPLTTTLRTPLASAHAGWSRVAPPGLSHTPDQRPPV